MDRDVARCTSGDVLPEILAVIAIAPAREADELRRATMFRDGLV